MHMPVCKLLSCVSVLVWLSHPGSSLSVRGEFNESLYLRSVLPYPTTLTHFHFSLLSAPEQFSLSPASSSSSSSSSLYFSGEHDTVPKVLSQLLERYDLEEVRLSFSQGRWNLPLWGEPLEAVPSGASLYVRFSPSTSLSKSKDVAARLEEVKRSLSGLSCASLSLLDETRTVPFHWRTVEHLGREGERHHGNAERDRKRGEEFYGVLSRETVCTENLTPWLKLLPCRHHQGLAALINPKAVYRSQYHAMTLSLSRKRDKGESSSLSRQSVRADMTLTVVQKPLSSTHSLPLTLRDIIRPPSDLSGISHCPIARRSDILTEVIEGEDILPQFTGSFSVPSNSWTLSSDMLREKAKEVKRDDKQKVCKVSVLSLSSEALSLSQQWLKKWTPSRSNGKAAVDVHRFLYGVGQARGGVTTRFSNLSPFALSVRYLDILPWFLRAYYHSLRVSINGTRRSIDEVFSRFEVRPAEDHGAPGVTMLEFNLPPLSVVLFSLDVDKVFLPISDYPPDASRGFDIGPGYVTFSRGGQEKRQEALEVITEPLLVMLPTPDFTMPYNVITLTSTLIAFIVGTLLNAVARKKLPSRLETAIEEKKKAEIKKVKKPSLGSKIRQKLIGTAAKVKED